MRNNHLFSRTSSSIVRFTLCAAMLGGLYVGGTASAQTIDLDATVTYTYSSELTYDNYYEYTYEDETYQIDTTTMDVDLTLQWVEGNTYKGSGTFIETNRDANLIYEWAYGDLKPGSYDNVTSTTYIVEVTATRNYDNDKNNWVVLRKIKDVDGNLVRSTVVPINGNGVVSDVSNVSNEYPTYDNPANYYCYAIDYFDKYITETNTPYSASRSSEITRRTTLEDTWSYGYYYWGKELYRNKKDDNITFNPSE